MQYTATNDHQRNTEAEPQAPSNRILGPCTFAPDLDFTQREIIAECFEQAFDQIVDLDVLKQYDPAMVSRAIDEFDTNGNLCFYMQEEHLALLNPDNPRRREFENMANSTNPEISEQGEAVLRSLDFVQRVRDLGMSALELGLFRGLQAVRNAEGELEVQVSWCLTTRKRGEGDTNGCPSGDALEVLVNHAVGVAYENLKKPEYWDQVLVEQPGKIALAPRNTIRIFEKDSSGKEIGAPWRSSDIDDGVLRAKREFLRAAYPDSESGSFDETLERVTSAV